MNRKMTPSVPVSVRGVVAKSYTRSIEVVITLACLPTFGLASLIVFSMASASGSEKKKRPNCLTSSSPDTNTNSFFLLTTA